MDQLKKQYEELQVALNVEREKSENLFRLLKSVTANTGIDIWSDPRIKMGPPVEEYDEVIAKAAEMEHAARDPRTKICSGNVSVSIYLFISTSSSSCKSS